MEVTSVVLSFNKECVKTAIAAMLGVMGKNKNKVSNVAFGLNNFDINIKNTITIVNNF